MGGSESKNVVATTAVAKSPTEKSVPSTKTVSATRAVVLLPPCVPYKCGVDISPTAFVDQPWTNRKIMELPRSHSSKPTIIMVRHGEKPSSAQAKDKEKGAKNKEDKQGKDDKHRTATVAPAVAATDPNEADYLSSRGWERAFAMQAYLAFRPEITRLGVIDAVVGMNPRGKDDKSQRPCDTILPAYEIRRAQMTRHVEWVDKFGEKDFVGAKNYLMNDCAGKTVALCWEHEYMSRLVAYLAGCELDDTLSMNWYPTANECSAELGEVLATFKYPDNRFDITYIVTWPEEKGPMHLTRICQNLLWNEANNTVSRDPNVGIRAVWPPIAVQLANTLDQTRANPVAGDDAKAPGALVSVPVHTQ